jgi:hypothetical protein
MGVYLYDVDGYVGDVGTNLGWSELCAYLSTSGSKMGRALVKWGYTLVGNDLFEIADPKDPDVAMTLMNLQQLALKCSEILIVSDGEEPE